MARIRGRAKAILEEARQPLTEAEARLETCRQAALLADADFNTQQTVVAVLRQAYGRLERALAPQPRQSATKSSAKKPVAARKSGGKKRAGMPQGTVNLSGPPCLTCGAGENDSDHFQPSPHYHPFASSASVPNAGKPSSANNGERSGIASIADETESVSTAAGTGD